MANFLLLIYELYLYMSVHLIYSAQVSLVDLLVSNG
jgi:hypothetical protein